MGAEWVRLEPAGEEGIYRLEAADPESATHVAVEAYRAALQQLQEERERNARLYQNLQRTIRSKDNWRRRALGQTKHQQEKWEIRHMAGGYYSLRVVELEAEEPEVALAEAEHHVAEFSRATRRLARLGRVYRHGPMWLAEVWTWIRPDYDAFMRMQAEAEAAEGTAGAPGGPPVQEGGQAPGAEPGAPPGVLMVPVDRQSLVQRAVEAGVEVRQTESGRYYAVWDGAPAGPDGDAWATPEEALAQAGLELLLRQVREEVIGRRTVPEASA